MAPQQQIHFIETVKRALGHITTADRLVLENASSTLIHLTLLPAIQELRRAIFHFVTTRSTSSIRPPDSTTKSSRR